MGVYLDIAERVERAGPGLRSGAGIAPTAYAADLEWDRFLSVCVPYADGSGFYDPSYGPLDLPAPSPPPRHPAVPAGWCTESWLKHLLHMAESCEELRPDLAAEYRRRAESIGWGMMP